MRVIFYAEPADEEEHAKSVPNYHSAGATFISVEELDEIVLRGDEPRDYFTKLMENFYYYPLDILSCWKHDKRSDQQRSQLFGSPQNSVPRPSPPPPTPVRQTTARVVEVDAIGSPRARAMTSPPSTSAGRDTVHDRVDRTRRKSKGRSDRNRVDHDPYSPGDGTVSIQIWQCTE